MLTIDPGFARRVALLVDDNGRYRSMLVRAMKALGYECVEAADGVEATEMLGAHPEIELALCDVHMPRMNGLELLVELRERWPGVAVMMITGVDDVDIAARCLQEGAMDFIAKPFRIEELRARVGSMMQRQRARLATGTA